MTSAVVTGVGFWAPAWPNAEALRSDLATATAQAEPPSGLLETRLARRASLLTRMMLEVAAQAGHQAAIDLTRVPTVFATARGELSTMNALLEMLQEGQGELSPTKFHNSVHNAASGYFSIALGNRAFSTTLSAGAETVPLALLEGFGLLADGHPTVLIVCADEPLCLPFLKEEGTLPLASAFCLTSRAAPALGRLALPRRAAVGQVGVPPPAFEGNPVAVCVQLIRALQQGQWGPLPLAVGTPGWIVDLASAHD